MVEFARSTSFPNLYPRRRSCLFCSDEQLVRHQRGRPPPSIAKLPGSFDLERDFTGSSGLFSVVFRPPLTRRDLHASMDRLKFFRMGYSWGCVSSLVVTPDLAEAPNARVYSDRLVRFYVGLGIPTTSSAMSSRRLVGSYFYPRASHVAVRAD